MSALIIGMEKAHKGAPDDDKEPSMGSHDDGGEDDDDDLDIASEDLADAFKSGDAKEIKDALCSFLEIYKGKGE